MKITFAEGFTQEDYDKRLRLLAAQAKNRQRHVTKPRSLKTAGARAKAMLTLAKAHEKTADRYDRHWSTPVRAKAELEREYARQYRANAAAL